MCYSSIINYNQMVIFGHNVKVGEFEVIFKKVFVKTEFIFFGLGDGSFPL